MEYITTARFKHKALCGDVNLPAKTAIAEQGGFYYHDGKRLCATRSYAARGHFARNDDGKGMERGKLTAAIERELRLKPGETPAHRDKRWDVVWSDPVCRKYKKQAQEDFWLWDMDFYHAPIADLEYIHRLVCGGKKGV